MKNQYVGDVGDYGKYSLLRAFADAGIKVGVNWYLTKDDGSNDGKFTTYLNDTGMRRRCPEVFDALKEIAFRPDKSVRDVINSNIIPNAVYYDNFMKPEGTPPEREYLRNAWFFKSLDALAGCELIFMDPDTGLLVSNEPSQLGAERYALPDEVEMYYKAGYNVVYYCHKGRRTFRAWQEYKSEMFKRIPEAKPAVLTYHKGTQRSYVLLIHEKSYIEYRKIIDSFLGRWRQIFSEEYTDKGDAAGETVGNAFTVVKSDGTVVTIEHRVDGKIQIKSSAEPHVTRTQTPDMFCRDLGL